MILILILVPLGYLPLSKLFILSTFKFPMNEEGCYIDHNKVTQENVILHLGHFLLPKGFVLWTFVFSRPKKVVEQGHANCAMCLLATSQHQTMLYLSTSGYSKYEEGYWIGQHVVIKLVKYSDLKMCGFQSWPPLGAKIDIFQLLGFQSVKTPIRHLLVPRHHHIA